MVVVTYSAYYSMFVWYADSNSWVEHGKNSIDKKYQCRINKGCLDFWAVAAKLRRLESMIKYVS